MLKRFVDIYETTFDHPSGADVHWAIVAANYCRRSGCRSKVSLAFKSSQMIPESSRQVMYFSDDTLEDQTHGMETSRST